MIFITPLEGCLLANQLRLLAHTIAFGMETGHRVLYPDFHTNSRHFPDGPRGPMCGWGPGGASAGTAPKWARRGLTTATFQAARGVTFALHHGLPLPLTARLLANHNWLDKVSLDDPARPELRDPRQLLVIRGQEFRAYGSLNRHADAVRALFRPTPEVADAVRASLAPARAACDVVVAVHVRRWDYRTFHGGRYFFEFSQYAEVMRSAAAQFTGRRVGFVVCSTDDIPADAFGDLSVWRGPGSALGDLYAMAACDRVVGPPSSFNQWASFYGDAPLHWIESPDAPVRFAGYDRTEREWTELKCEQARRDGTASEPGGSPPELASPDHSPAAVA